MKENSFLWVGLSYLRSRREAIGLAGIFYSIYVAVFYLYSLEFDALAYAFVLSAWVAAVFMVYDFTKYYRKHNQLLNLAKQARTGLQGMPLATDLLETDYQEILLAIYDEKTQLISKVDNKQTEMIDYFTLWAHQIKTPLAAMRLLVQSEPSEHHKELLAQMFKIEQYVEMVLGYLKIDDSSSDLVLENYNLLDLVKQAVRKYAHLFIKKNMALELKEEDCIVLTDEKWLVFVIEQILSNALKYTNSGKISIHIGVEERKTLVIEDTGIGIAEEDLPRVFEKGFTGYNGRMDKKATGIGLYLCKKILDKLSHTITITSTINVGTRVEIDLSSTKTTFE